MKKISGKQRVVHFQYVSRKLGSSPYTSLFPTWGITQLGPREAETEALDKDGTPIKSQLEITLFRKLPLQLSLFFQCEKFEINIFYNWEFLPFCYNKLQ